MSDHYPIELRLQGTDIANAMDNDNDSDNSDTAQTMSNDNDSDNSDTAQTMSNDNDSDNSDTAQTMSLSCVVVLSVVVVTTHLLM